MLCSDNLTWLHLTWLNLRPPMAPKIFKNWTNSELRVTTTKLFTPVISCFSLAICSNYTITNTLRLSIYTSMNTFSKPQPLSACASNILDTLSDILDKCLRFSLIKIESVSIFISQALLGSFLLICCIYFPIKIVLIKN